VLLDVITADHVWGKWAADTLVSLCDDYKFAINPVIYAEVSLKFYSIDELEEAISPVFFERLPIPNEAIFLAGKCYMKYKKDHIRTKTPILPDFFIGAHATVSSMKLVTRNTSKYKKYFPKLELVTP
jgi:predicted nucleic acid-binding protein